jgi:RNA polymerase sigma-70 factor, ECF subfamily
MNGSSRMKGKRRRRRKTFSRGGPPAHWTRPPTKEQAFHALFQKETFARVLDWLRRLCVPELDRMDLAQDVFLGAYESFPSYDPARADARRWLNRIAVHHAAHYHARARHRREVLGDGAAFVVADERPDVEERMWNEQVRCWLLERLQALAPEERSVLLAHDIEEIPMAAVAARHGIPVTTAYKRRARGLAALIADMRSCKG